MRLELATTRAVAHLLSVGLPIERKEDAVALLVKSVEDNNAAVALRLKAIEASDKSQAEKLVELDAALTELWQKSSRRGGGEEGPETWGQQFVKSPDLKAFAENASRPGRLRLDVKTTITSGSGSGGALSTPYRDGVVMMPQRRLVVRDLLPVVPISTGSVEYPKQNARTNAADLVAEGLQKPESEYGWGLQTAPARVIAHWIPASRQVLDDAPQLAGLIDGELRYGLALKEEQQLLNGSGTGQNLLGMVTQATAYSAPFVVSGSTMLDQLALALLQVALSDFQPDGIIMHPSDWMRIRLIKDANGQYIIGNPQGNTAPNLWGVPVVTTTAMAADKFLVGAFQASATIYDRWAPRVEVSTEHADFFTRNLVAILAEERLALAVKQAAALVYGDFGNVA